jgi:hypothetical protein
LSVSDRAICQEEPWFSICCDRTLNDSQWGVIPYGCVSSSGYGDGCYEVNYISDKDGEAVRVEINFIPDEEEESDEDEDED